MGRLPKTQEIDRSEAFAPLLRLLDGVFITTETLAERWQYKPAVLARMRRTGKGPTWIRLPTGGIRYPVAAVVRCEMAGTSGPITLDRVKLTVAACSELSEAQRASVIARLDRAFT